MSAATVALRPVAAKIAREYLRLSADPSGRLISNIEQSEDNAEAAAEHGWQLSGAYEESGAVSASRYGHKARAGFAELVADLESGAFGADVLIMWEASRGSRRAWEWARLIEALRAARVCVFITGTGKLYDPANMDDRRTLRDSASDAEYESDKISVRVGRSMRKEAAAGRPHGRQTFGYQREHRLWDGGPIPDGWYRLDPKKAIGEARIGRQIPHPSESVVVVLIFAMILAGESLRNIAHALAGLGPRASMGADLRAAAVRYAGNPAPGVWVPTRVRDIALNPAYAGKRLHVPGGHLASARVRDYSVSDLTDGLWPALVSFADWQTVQAKLRDPKRTTSGPGRQPVHLLSMIATCGTCGGPMTGRAKHGGRWVYLCRDGGHTTVEHDALDALVAGAVQARLAAPDTYPAMAEREDTGALAAARDALAMAKQEHADLAAAVGAGRLSLTLAASAEPAILARIAAAERMVRELSAPSALGSLGLAPGADIFARWQSAPLSARRAAVRALLSVRVMAVGRTGRAAPVTERVVIDWR